MPTDNEQATASIAEMPSPHREIVERLRSMIDETVPDVEERFGWGRPLYYVDGQAVFYLKANKNDVTLGFDQGAHLDDPHGVLVGTGKDKRNTKIASVDQLDADVYGELLRAAVAHARGA